MDNFDHYWKWVLAAVATKNQLQTFISMLILDYNDLAANISTGQLSVPLSEFICCFIFIYVTRNPENTIAWWRNKTNMNIVTAIFFFTYSF